MDALYSKVYSYIQSSYAGIFSPEDMQKHFDTYVKVEISRDQFTIVQALTGLKDGGRLLDLGCGFGSFVLAARQEGVEAYGVDIAQFDLEFARKRMDKELDQQQPQKVYLERDAQNTKLPDRQFDVITAWNVLEHVPNYKKLIKEANRLLKEGGYFIGVAPNYFSFRKEAHYQVWWFPLLPKRLGRIYLRLMGKDPSFLDHSIFYLTNIGTLRALKKAGFKLSDPRWTRFLHPELIRSRSRQKLLVTINRLKLAKVAKLIFFTSFWNPFKPSIFFCAQRRK